MSRHDCGDRPLMTWNRPLVPARVAVGNLLLGLIFGSIVGAGGNPWCLGVVPLCAAVFIAINRVDR